MKLKLLQFIMLASIPVAPLFFLFWAGAMGNGSIPTEYKIDAVYIFLGLLFLASLSLFLRKKGWIKSSGVFSIFALLPCFLVAAVIFKITFYEHYEKNCFAHKEVERASGNIDDFKKLFMRNFAVDFDEVSNGYFSNNFPNHVTPDQRLERKIVKVVDAYSVEELQKSGILDTALNEVHVHLSYDAALEMEAKLYVTIKNKINDDPHSRPFYQRQTDKALSRIAEIGLEKWHEEVINENPVFAMISPYNTNMKNELEEEKQRLTKIGSPEKFFNTSKTLGSVPLYVALSFTDYPDEFADDHYSQVIAALNILQKYGFDFSPEEKSDPVLQKFLERAFKYFDTP